MRVLLSNDDGVNAPGLAALAAAFPDDEVWVVAPDREQSASSHAISLHRPLRIVDLGGRRFSVDGTPTDAVYLALNHVLRGRPPDLVRLRREPRPQPGQRRPLLGHGGSGHGGGAPGRLGHRRLAGGRGQPHDFGPAAAFAAGLARRVASQRPASPTLFNVNVPAGPVKGYRLTRLGVRTYGNEVVEKLDPRGRSYFWIGGDASHQDIPLSDCNTVFDEGLVAVTPLHLDLTHDALLGGMTDFSMPGYRKEPDP